MKALVYQKALGLGKPSDFGKVKDICPFCDYKDFENIIATSGEAIWTRNKYPVLANTQQTLIIETDKHDAHLGNYEKEEAYNMLKFAFAAWEKMKENKNFKSVIFYKNHGPLSGGTLSHAHLQIVGLEEVDAYEKIRQVNFEGIDVIKEEALEVNFSTQPFCGTRETNILLEKKDFEEYFPRFCEIIQKVFSYHLEMHIFSFNLFVYDFEDQYIVKFTTRFPTAPYFVGFGIPQVIDADSLRAESLVLAKKLKK